MSQLLTRGLLSNKLLTQGYFGKTGDFANGIVRIVGTAKSFIISGIAKSLKISGVSKSIKIKGGE